MSEIKQTLQWFQQAIPEPTIAQRCIQIGVHMEEFAEMLNALGDKEEHLINELSNEYKQSHQWRVDCIGDDLVTDKNVLLDSIADQIVTAVGVCHVMGFDIEGALAEVNRSNFSKFEDGKPVFDDNGKITKGKHYSKPDLKPYISSAALENKMNIDKLETQSEEQPKRIKVEYVKVDYSVAWQAAKDHEERVEFLYRQSDLCEAIKGNNWKAIQSPSEAAQYHFDLYRRIETEITERDEFVEEFKSQHDKWVGSNIEYFAEKLFDSGKFKLVGGNSNDYKSLLKKVIKTVCSIEGVDSDWITHDAFYDKPRFTKDEITLIEQLEKEEAN